MDSLSAPPSKKYRKATNIDIPIIECKREFNLPHKYPSMVNSSKHNFMLKDHRTVTIANSEISGKFSEFKNKKGLATDIKKLRIKTQDGKDLGEIKLQYLTQKNVAYTQKINYIEQIANNKKNNTVNFSTVPQNNVNELLKSLESRPRARGSQKPIVEPQSCATGSQLVFMPISSNEHSTVVNKKLSEIQNKSRSTFQKHYVFAKLSKVDFNELLNENGCKSVHNNPGVSETVEPDNNNLVLENKKKNESFIEKKHTFNNRRKDVINEYTCVTTKPKISREIEISNVKNSKTQLAKSKFPLVRCEKLSVSKNGITASPIKTNKETRCNLNMKNYSPEKITKSTKSTCSLKLSEDKKQTISHLQKTTKSTQKKFKITNNGDENDISIIYKKGEITDKYSNNNVQEKNCISAPVNSKSIDSRNQSVCIETSNKLNSCQNKLINKNKYMQNRNSKLESNSNVIITEQAADNTKKEELSKSLNVIMEALTSVKDEQLRAKALHALAECGIGIAKQVPIIPPEKLRTVHDSQIQTDVFGLLEMENFVLVKGNVSALERIKQTERSVVDPPVMENVQTQTEVQTQPKITSNDFINNIDLFPMWTSEPIQYPLDLDNYFNEYFHNNCEVNRVKKILSTPHSLYKKVATQLEKDYNEMQQTDENGMLNIHRAVVNDQLQEVQRLLLVLDASKTNIDVLTDNEMTSLELAIKFGASKDMVKLLLEAGAKPILPELLHESAVILASKLSSPYLSHLLQHVTEHELLNQVDSSGMAPLHYCALNGYLEGVDALIEIGAEVNLKDNRSGRTPFFHALENNHVSVAQKLLEHGAIADLPNFSGQSVLSIIDEAKSLSLKAALKQIVI